MNLKSGHYLFYALVAFALGQVLYYYPQLPEIVASHFDGRGTADGWSSRNLFFGIYLAMLALTTGVFILLPRRIGISGSFARNIPNREHWLAPGRIDRTRAFLRRQMLVMGVIHLLLAITTVQLVILANLGQRTQLNSAIFGALAAYFVCVSAWVIHFILHFRKR